MNVKRKEIFDFILKHTNSILILKSHHSRSPNSCWVRVDVNKMGGIHIKTGDVPNDIGIHFEDLTNPPDPQITESINTIFKTENIEFVWKFPKTAL